MSVYISQKQFAAALEKLELDRDQVADLLGYNSVTVYRWMRPDGNVPAVVGVAIGLMLAKAVKPEKVAGTVRDAFRDLSKK